MIARALLWLALLLAPAGAAAAGFETSPLVIESGGRAHRFTVELALSETQRRQGLMFRRTLAPDAGMLFVYPRSGHHAMWMKNTLIPLDMLFLDRHGTIRRVHERAVPLTLRAIPSGGRVRAVLELPGGTAARLGIQPGDRVRHPLLR